MTIETQLLLVPTAPRDGLETVGEFHGLYPPLQLTLNTPLGKRPRTAVVSIHPTGNQLQYAHLRALADRGFATIGLCHRYVGNDSALFMEVLMIDIAGAVRFAKKQGFERIVLLGSSGGGSVTAMYQSQAENPTITSTPAGDPPDLTKEDLPRADGVILLAAHGGRAQVLADWIDPSVVDESDPVATDPSLDMFNPKNGPPYSSDFVTRYRPAQVERNHRITRWAKSRIAALESLNDGTRDMQFAVFRTNADLSALDGTIDPSERTTSRSRSTYRGDLYVVNRNPYHGLIRFTTCRSWLSQWSLSATHADGYVHAGRVSVPVLLVSYGADEVVYPRYMRGYFEAIKHDDKEMHTIPGAGHFIAQQPEKHAEVMDLVADWMKRKGY